VICDFAMIRFGICDCSAFEFGHNLIFLFSFDSFVCCAEQMLAKYLGSNDYILTLQNLTSQGISNGHVTIHHNEYLNGVDGRRKYQIRSTVKIPGSYLSSLEICGIPRIGKTYAALVGSSLTSPSRSCLYFLDLNTQYQSPTLSLVDTKIYSESTSEINEDAMVSSSQNSPSKSNQHNNNFNHFPNSSFHLTTSSYDSDYEIIALGNEHGDVTLFDVITGRELHSINADPIGIKNLQFLPSKQLVSMGNSPQKTVKIWDLRMPSTNSAITAEKIVPRFEEYNCFHSNIRHNNNLHSNSPSEENSPTNNNSGSLLSKFPQLTCFVNHPTQEKLFLGSSQGNIYLWDYRLPHSYCVEYHPHFAAGKSSHLVSLS
jgi:hypothetical protein